MTKYVLLTVGVTLVVILGLVFGTPLEVEQPRTLNVSALESSKVFAAGRVDGATQEIALHSLATGRITQVLVEEGQLVDAGQVLLETDPRRQLHEVALMSAELARSQAELERLVNGASPEDRAEAEALYRAKSADLQQAQLTWQRTQPLRQADAISQQEADNQQSRVASLTAEVEAARSRLQRELAPAREDEVKIAQARVDAAHARLNLAEHDLDDAKLRSPVRGRVLRINREIGELVGPTSAEPAIIVAGTGTFHVRAFVEEMDAPRIRKGMAAEIVADGLPGRKFKGRIVRLSPRMGSKTIWTNKPTERSDTKTREIWIELDEAEDLVIGLRVDVLINLRDRHNLSAASPRAGNRLSAAANSGKPIHKISRSVREQGRDSMVRRTQQ